MKNKITLALIAATVSSGAVANTYLGVNLGWASLNDTCSMDQSCDDDNLSTGAYLGYKWNDYIATEVGYDYLGSVDNSQIPMALNGDISALTLESVFSLPITERFDAYAKIGVAQMFADNSEDYVATAGMGIEYKLNWNLAVRAEYQYFEGIDSLSNDVDVNQVSFGFQYKFGQPTPIFADRIVEQKRVESYEKTVDSIYQQEETVLNFSLNSAVIDNKPLLEKTISQLKLYPQANVIITGHTDSSGYSSYNDQLAEQRSAVVALYLEQQGIEADRIVFEGKGDSSPIADNGTVQGRQANRRAEVVIPSFEYQTQESAEREVVVETVVTEDVSPNWW